jgi:hypothetical protein
MWYYRIEDQEFGPFSVDQIEQLLLEGKITRITSVRREDRIQWESLDESDLVVIFRDDPKALYPAPSRVVPPPLPFFQPLVKINELTALFWVWFGLYLALNVVMDIYMILIAKIYPSFILMPDESTYMSKILPLTILVLLQSLLGNGSTVLDFILLYYFWKTIQDGRASTTPGKAVGFLFIPFFNFYWVFRALYCLARDQNRFINYHFKDRGLRKSHPALPLISILSPIGIFLAMIIYFPVVAIKLQLSSITSISEFAPIMIGFTIIEIVAMTIGMLLKLFTYLDFFLTSHNILTVQVES